ncbi:Ferric/cupric reductase transmembrane component 2 [Paramyrothecium foliicola]|nr:Ferric/cupric reductase transmembrane component 2 [Paramyrothecium foliicola]
MQDRRSTLAAANMAFCVFLGLKNTPLTRFGKPHNELYPLHRFVGYTAIVQTSIHGLLYTLHLFFTSRIWKLLGPGTWEGLAAGLAMIVLLLGLSNYLRYNTFLISHILGAAAATGFAALHRPDWKKKMPCVMLTITLIWGFDRLIRLRRYLSNFVGNRATLYPLPNGALRLVLSKPLKGAQPGLHCFLWIPELFLLRTHPFSIVSITSSEMEFVIKAHDGFTKRLYEIAVECPGKQFRASVDGPYGSIPNREHYQNIIMIAGGSGAAYTFGLASTMLDGWTEQHMRFLWAVKNPANLTWFSDQLADMERSPHVDVSLYVTRHDPDGENTNSMEHSIDSSSSGRCCVGERRPLLQGCATKAHNYIGCMEAVLGEIEVLDDKAIADITYQKLDLEKALSERTEALSRGTQVLITVCGPRNMAEAVRKISREIAATQDIKIDVHSEAFSW